LSGCYDLDVWLRITRLRPANIRSLDEITVLYRRRRGQITKVRTRMQTAWHQLVDKMRSIEPERVRALEPRARANTYRYFAFIEYENRDLHAAWQLMRTSLTSHWPSALTHPRTWMLTA